MLNRDLNFILSSFTSKKYAKGDLLIREGQVCNYIYYFTEGLAKLRSINGDREFIMRFISENTFATVIDSFTEQKPSHFEIIALEKCEVLLLHRDDFEALCKSHPAIETFFRKFLQIVAANMLKRISESLENDAKHRYEIFLQHNHSIIQRISLGDVANYLGITQVTLSRIRANP